MNRTGLHQLIKEVIKEETQKILIPRRLDSRKEDYLRITNQKIKKYMEDGGKGDLDLENTPITQLPQDLKVGGDLDLRNTPITQLPQGLTVGGSLYLYKTPITQLSQGLTVGGYLYLGSTKITQLPQDLKVGGDLYLDNTPISKSYTEEQIRQMVPGVKGKIYL